MNYHRYNYTHIILIIYLHCLSLQIVESVVKKYEEGSTKAIEDMTLDELEEVEDDADEAILLQYRYPSVITHNVIILFITSTCIL